MLVGVASETSNDFTSDLSNNIVRSGPVVGVANDDPIWGVSDTPPE